MMLGVISDISASVAGVRTFFEELATTEGRLAVSGALLFITAVVAIFLVPYAIGKLGGTLREHVLNERTVSLVDTVAAYIPTTFSGLFVGLAQLGLFILAVVSLLMVWGLVDAAVAVIRLTGLSIPLLATVGVTFGIFLGAYIAMDLFDELIEQFSQEADRVTDHQQEILLRLSHLGVITFAVTGVLTLWGINLSGLLVGAGFLGIVVGMAARETLGSIIAGFVLMFSRPFTLGDWVEVGDHEGIVTNITIMNTRLKNFDGEAIVIPNDIVSNRPITNRTDQGHLRTRLDVGIDYEADPERAQEIALETIERLDAVADAPPPQVVSKAFGDSAIVLELRFWIERPTPQHRWHAIESVIHAVKERFENEGIKIPYPQRELSGRAETGGFRVRDAAPESSVETPRPAPED
jgi:small-conductance mechanosensitive channel